MTIAMPDILNRSLAEIAHSIADETQRAALYDALAQQRERWEPKINAFELRREESPKDVAGPLNGLPITIKDQIAAAGWPRSFGCERTASKADGTNAGFVEQLIRLGVEVTGKTALPPNALDFQTFNQRRGSTNNPHHLDFTAGGSSGGGAAAVASGMSLLDIGADLAGSLRIPAAWCGVTSLTPTEGLWPNDGMLPNDQKLDHFARIGLIARNIEDLGWIWDCLASDARKQSESTRASQLSVWKPGSISPCDAITSAAWKDLPAQISGAKILITSDQMQDLFTPEVYRLFGEIMGHETGALIPWPIRFLMRLDRSATLHSPDFVAHVHVGYRRSKARLSHNIDRLKQWRQEALIRRAHIDAFILPVTGISAFKHMKPSTDRNGVRDYDHQFETHAGPLGYFDALTRFTVPITLLGWPVVTIPMGFDKNGLPMGMQLVGKPHSEKMLLELAERISIRSDNAIQHA